MKTEKITIEALVKADAEKTWQYYTAPEHIINWNFASPDWHCPEAENDLEVGGVYSATMAAKDGSFSFDFWGIYSDLNIGKSYTLALGDLRRVEVTLTPDGDSTLVTVTFDAETENDVEMQRNGWQAILNNFEQYAEAN